MLAARGYMSIDRGLPMSGNELNVLAAFVPVNPCAKLGVMLRRGAYRKWPKENIMNPAQIR